MGRNVSDPLYQTFKHINLNKIHRSNKRVTRDKESLEIDNVVFKTKGPQIRCFLHGSLGLPQCK